VKLFKGTLLIWMDPVVRLWRKLSKFWRHFLTSFVIGLTIVAFLHIVHHTSWVVEAENWAMDSMMAVNQSLPRMTSSKSNVDFAYIDIDENTYREWDEPYHLPRKKLTKLIEFASEGGARAIVLDVDLSKASNEDDELLSFLKEYKKENPPLFLIKVFYPPSEMTDGDSNMIRPSFLDKTTLGPQIIWVQSSFRRDLYDGVVRYWDLLRFGCADGKPMVVPSVQLMVDAHLFSSTVVESLLKKLSLFNPENCSDINKHIERFSGELLYGDRKISLVRDRIGERIIYTMPWQQTMVPGLVTIPARRISDTTQKLSNDLVKGRVVVIGGSYRDGRDIYNTPLGEMPGALVITNAIKSLHVFGQIKAPKTEIKWLIELGLILMISWAFTRFLSLLGTVVSGAIIVIILVPVSFYFFKFGLWVDFAVPLIGILFHQLIAKYEESVVMKNKLKNLQST